MIPLLCKIHKEKKEKLIDIERRLVVARDGDGVGEMCEGGWNINRKKISVLLRNNNVKKQNRE